MKKVLTAFLIGSVIMVSCKKNLTSSCGYNIASITAPATEIDSLKTLLQDSGIVANQNPIGFFYTIGQPGSGTSINNLCSTVSVSYTGKFFTGQIFDSTATGKVATYQLGQFIIGWQKALPLIKKDGDITLYIPPSLAYGPTTVYDTNGNVVIPASSYLIFQIHLADIQ